MASETQMKEAQARKAAKRALLILENARTAQDAGWHFRAAQLFEQAIYEAQGASVMEKSLADEKRVSKMHAVPAMEAANQ